MKFGLFFGRIACIARAFYWILRGVVVRMLLLVDCGAAACASHACRAGYCSQAFKLHVYTRAAAGGAAIIRIWVLFRRRETVFCVSPMNVQYYLVSL